MKLNINLSTGLCEWKKARTKAQHQVVAFKVSATKIGDDHFEVFEADVLANPQAFALVEHGRVRGIAVHTVGAAWRDDANFGHALTGIQTRLVALDVLHGVAHLHGAGVRAQQVWRFGAATFHIEGVVHGTCRMVFRRVERGEIEPVSFNLWALGHFKTHRTKNGFDAFERDRHRVQTASHAGAAGQGDIQGFGFELGLEFGIGQGLTAGSERGLYRLLGHVDGGTGGFLFFHAQSSHALHHLGDAA